MEGLSLEEAVGEAREKAKQAKEEGVNQAALDEAAAKGFGNALFEHDEDEMSLVVEEFYSPPREEANGQVDCSSVVTKLQGELETALSASK